jgi:hypothetical protein
LACSLPARTARDPAILIASRIVNQIRPQREKSLEEL